VAESLHAVTAEATSEPHEHRHETPQLRLERRVYCSKSLPGKGVSTRWPWLTDPSGLLFGFSYGKYCGWSKAGPGDPDDALDAACKRHDKCQASWLTCNPYHVMLCSIKLCDEALDAKRGGCFQSYPPSEKAKRVACKKAAGKVAGLFCFLSGATISHTSPIYND